MMPSNHLILCHPLLLLPSIFANSRVFSNESALCIKWPRYWRLSINPFKEYSGLISFKIAWFDLLAIQETLKNLLQLHISRHICKSEAIVVSPGIRSFGNCLYDLSMQWPGLGRNEREEGVSSPSAVPGPASPRKLLETHALELYPRTAEWETSSAQQSAWQRAIHTVTLCANTWEPLLSILSISEWHGGGSRHPADSNMFPSRTHLPVIECLLFPR